MRLFILYLLFISMAVAGRIVEADDYTPGDFHNYAHASGNVPEDVYQYSVYVPADYDPGKSYPLVFYLHGGGKGRFHPNQAKRNMVSNRLMDNNRATDAGYTRHAPDFIGYILVSPVKPVVRWKPAIFGRLYGHVKSKLSIDENRVYVTGFSMGGQGTWRVACGNDGTYNIAAMMPLGAWGCDEVQRGTTPETCKTTKTAVWVLHCPLDPVSKISEQLTLFQSHLDCGGYGRFTTIPGKGHISRPRNDYEFFSMRMGWMLAQTYGTPFNYVVKVNDGTIVKAADGKRPYTGDNNRFGFYEPGTVVNITAPEAKNGKSFVKWASVKGTFDDASSRSTSYTTPTGDVVVSAIYGVQPYSLNVTGGTADPVAPLPGQVVTVTADTKKDEEKFSYWTTSTNAVDIAVPSARSFQFVMPSENVTFTVQGIRDQGEKAEVKRWKAKDSVDYETLERKLEAAVAEGKLTEEEAKAKWKEITKKTEDDEGFKPVPTEAAQKIGAALIKEAVRSKKLPSTFEGDPAKAVGVAGVAEQEERGIILVPQKGLDEDNMPDMTVAGGAPLAVLFTPPSLVPVVEGAIVDRNKLHGVTITDGKGNEHKANCMLLTVRMISEDDYRLYGFGTVSKPLIDVMFTDSKGPGAMPVTLKIKEVEGQHGLVVITVFGKYQATFHGVVAE